MMLYLLIYKSINATDTHCYYSQKRKEILIAPPKISKILLLITETIKVCGIWCLQQIYKVIINLKISVELYRHWRGCCLCYRMTVIPLVYIIWPITIITLFKGISGISSRARFKNTYLQHLHNIIFLKMQLIRYVVFILGTILL